MNLRGQLHNTEDFVAFELAFIYIHSLIDKMINDYIIGCYRLFLGYIILGYISKQMYQWNPKIINQKKHLVHHPFHTKIALVLWLPSYKQGKYHWYENWPCNSSTLLKQGTFRSSFDCKLLRLASLASRIFSSRRFLSTCGSTSSQMEPLAVSSSLTPRSTIV